MYKRELTKLAQKYAKQYPIVTITGPRQSGKTTLTHKSAFSNYRYISLEDPDVREYALSDPRNFLNQYSNQVIFDEVQRAPDLFSYLQTTVDEDPTPGRFILTGSQQFLLNKNVSQTLAGRTALLRLLPLSLSELNNRSPQTCWTEKKIQHFSVPEQSIYYYLYHGLYPRIHSHHLDPKQYYRDYIETYVTRDLQQLVHIGDLQKFHIFLRVIAARCGQRINMTSLGNDLGLSHTTIHRWLSALQASYIIMLLSPHFKNFNKRLVKSPKLYFLDSGLLCYLLRVENNESLPFHPHIGGIFETFVLTELYKAYYHRGLDAPLYFWQDQSHHEIDIIIDQGIELFPIEVKASQTLSGHFFDNINTWLNFDKNPQNKGMLIYSGKDYQTRQNIEVLPWYAVS